MDSNLIASLGGLGIFVLGSIALCVYLLPTIVAFFKKRPYKWIVCVLNVFFGLTVIVWVAVLIWALFPKDKSDAVGKTLASAASGVKSFVNEKSGNNMNAELEKINKLKETGAINEEEFAKMKEKVFAKYEV